MTLSWSRFRPGKGRRWWSRHNHPIVKRQRRSIDWNANKYVVALEPDKSCCRATKFHVGDNSSSIRPLGGAEVCSGKPPTRPPPGALLAVLWPSPSRHVPRRMITATAENVEEAWLPAAEAELTALAAEAEKVERMPDTLLSRPPPPGGVDLITPDPRYSTCISRVPRQGRCRVRSVRCPGYIRENDWLGIGCAYCRPGSAHGDAAAYGSRLPCHILKTP